MPHLKIIVRSILAATLIALLSACSSTAPVKEITSDKLGYLSRNFSAQSLSPVLAKKVPSDDRSAKFKQLTIKTEESVEELDGKKESWKTVSTYLNSENGLVQRVQDLMNNDIPFALKYSLTYKGFFDFRTQYVSLGRSNAEPIIEIKDVMRLDTIPSVADKEFEINYTYGVDTQATMKCRTTGTRTGSEIHKKIPGQITDIECENIKNNVLLSRTKWIMFQEYGFAIILEATGSSRKVYSRVVDFKG